MTTRITEDTFLDARIGHPITIYLINGIKLTGMILEGHDVDAIFLLQADEMQDGTMMVAKQAISTVLSSPVSRPRIPHTNGLDGILHRRKQT
jgi:sRNA-binding regulator protein Hfq